jgi:hypothetical protein
MRSLLASAAVLTLGLSLSACAYYDDEYGPGYGPPPGQGAYSPPPAQGEYGPPPGGGEYGPPPGEQRPSQEYGPSGGQGGYGPPPPSDESGPPSAEESGPPPSEGYGPAYGTAPPRAVRVHRPRWCARHPHKCARQEQRAYSPPQ